MKKKYMGLASFGLAIAFCLTSVIPAHASTVTLGAKSCGAAPVYVAVKSTSVGTVTHTIYNSPGVGYAKTYFNAGLVERKTVSGYVSSYVSYVTASGGTLSASTYCQGPV